MFKMSYEEKNVLFRFHENQPEKTNEILLITFQAKIIKINHKNLRCVLTLFFNEYLIILTWQPNFDSIFFIPIILYEGNQTLKIRASCKFYACLYELVWVCVCVCVCVCSADPDSVQYISKIDWNRR